MHTGIAIALAWPETLCKQAGAWYDGLMNTFGFSKNNYYKVGHAAVVLIEKESGNCFYFDFGRYHAPFGHGRVRDVETDHDLEISTKAKFDENKNISNIEQILNELAQNEACHGTGTLHAAITNINFDKAYQYAKSMQEKSPWKYGPFIWSGTNCSRFVRTVILSGEPPFVEKLKLTIPYTISPTPIGNVKSLKGFKSIKNPNEIHSKSNYVLEKENIPTKSLHHTLEKPQRLDCIPKSSQWLSGEGAGSWFHISANQDKFSITRYSAQGKIECSGSFEIANNIQFDINTPYKFMHLSHCKIVNILQNGKVVHMKRQTIAQV